MNPEKKRHQKHEKCTVARSDSAKVIGDSNSEKLSGQSEIKYILVIKLFDTLQKLISAVAYMWAFYCVYLAVDSLAGKTTVANVIFSYLLSRDNDYGIPWFLAIIFFIWAVIERKERLRKVEALHKHNRDLEKYINPNRTGSGILPSGETNPKDEIL